MLNKRLLNFVIENMKKGRNLVQTQDNKPFYITKNKITFTSCISKVTETISFVE